MTVEQARRRFSPYELAELQIAEEAAPWGEAAANVRMLYLAARIQEASAGYTADSRKAAGRLAQRLLLKLLGPQPPRRPPRARDFASE
jgi:hypothetical protein